MSNTDRPDTPVRADATVPSTPEILDSADTAKIGQLIDGRYRILELIGRGGMGSVYKAEHVAIRRVVALKLLHPSLAQLPEVSRRFQREAFAIGRISHPNCVDVSDFGELDDGSLFLVMEYLKGHSLGDELADRGRLDPIRTMHILRHVLRGLGHAHSNNIVHRDVKPENVVLVEHDGDPDFAKILDFGIAKLIGEAAEDGGGKLTQAGMAFGTPIYMSPEQAVGNPIDGRADLYAATVMAYEMITGQPPFQSDDKLEVMSMHTAKPPPAMCEIDQGIEVPEGIEQLIRRGLAKRPVDRFVNADEYIAAIDQVLLSLGISVRAERLSAPVLTTTAQIAAAAVAATPAPGTLPSPVTTPTSLPAPTEGSLPFANASLPEPPLRTGLAGLDKRKRIIALAAAGILGMAGIVAIVTSGAGYESALPASSPADSQPALPLAEQAKAKLSRGAPKEAAALLTESGVDISNNAAAQLQLGHAQAALRNGKAALAAYRQALQLDPAQADDSKLRTNLRLMLDDRSALAVDAAILMLDELDDKSVVELLVSLPTSPNRGYDTRHRAIEEAEARGLSDQIDWGQALILDLRQRKACQFRRQTVAKLRALGDKRAIPELRKVRPRLRKKIPPCLRGLRDDIGEAVQYLESLDPPTAGPT